MKLGSTFYERHPWLQQFGLNPESKDGLITLRPQGFQLAPLVTVHYLVDPKLTILGTSLEIQPALWDHPWKFILARQICARFLQETLAKTTPNLTQELNPPEVGLAREYRVPPVPWMESQRLTLGEEKLWMVERRIHLAPAKTRECEGCGFPLTPKGKACARCGKAVPGNLWSRLGL